MPLCTKPSASDHIDYLILLNMHLFYTCIYSLYFIICCKARSSLWKSFYWFKLKKEVKRTCGLTLCLVQTTCPAPPSVLEQAGRQAQCCVGVNSGRTHARTRIHTWSSTVTSVPSVLSVFHFWLKLRPSSFILYLVSRLPEAFPESVLLEPDVLNSCWRGAAEEKSSTLRRWDHWLVLSSLVWRSSQQ